ncbi:MMPL family transporter [Oenococcus alcoholitolerans]|uniref:MMPL family transporter n=1 Tax=Oenococcus alcoholitolerans TaxID=931074 RepID=UPI003F71DB6C
MEKTLKRTRFLIIIFWLVLSAAAIFFLPNVPKLVQNKGQITVPKSAYVEKGHRLQKRLNPKEAASHDIIAVYHNNSKLTNEQIADIKQVVRRLSNDRNKYHVSAITSLNDGKSVQKQLTSKDKTTMLVQISLKSNQNQIGQRSQTIKKQLKVNGLSLKMTGSDLVTHDFASATQDGVKKTEVIAIVFILIVLILVFRTPIIPVISLLTVGVSFIISFSLVTNLVQSINFPFSNFTQVFMVVVLFGIGTDYNILMYNRFKSELAISKDSNLSAVNTLKTAGKTVLFSGSSVLIGFSALGLATFGLYQATSAVAIGVLTLLLVLTTLNPALMSLFGSRLFWPVKKLSAENNSKLWRNLTSSAVKHGLLTAIITLAVAIPASMIFSHRMNFNDLWEVSNKYESKQGINLISKHFPAGFSSPVTIILSSNKKLDNSQSLYDLDLIQNRINKDSQVSEVMGITRPLGDKINQLYVGNQLKTLNSGISNASSGIGQINSGLRSAKDQIAQQQGNTNGVQSLIDGTGRLQSGSGQLQNALNTLQSRLSQGAAGADQMNSAIATLASSTAQLKGGVDRILGQLNQTQMPSSAGLAGSLAGTRQQITALVGRIAAESANNPQALADIQNLANLLNTSFSSLQSQLGSLDQVAGNVSQLRSALTSVDQGLGQMQAGTAQLQSASGQLSDGLRQGADGAATIASRSQELTSGLAQIQAGQRQMQTALDRLGQKSQQLQDGLNQASNGLDRVNNGLHSGQNYINELIGNSSSDWLNVPNSVLHSKTFSRAFDTYMSPDRKTTRINVILKMNPFSRPAMSATNNLRKSVARNIQGTSLSKADIGVTGTSMQNYDLQEISTSDFTRTAIIMLIGIAIVLMLITRSVLNALTIITALAGTYFISLGIGEKISQLLLGRSELSWNVPFFGFIMLVALGVDYSIFVMMDYNEQRGLGKDRLIAASTHLGTVIISAAIILGGTFAAMIPSGILTLIQVAIVVITGLVILAFIAIPIFVPAVISIISWLYKRKLEAIQRVEKTDQ